MQLSTPQISRQNTLFEKPKSACLSHSQRVTRRKTFSHFGAQSHAVKKKPSVTEHEYVGLTEQCLQKNYDISGLQPFGYKVPM